MTITVLICLTICILVVQQQYFLFRLKSIENQNIRNARRVTRNFRLAINQIIDHLKTTMPSPIDQQSITAIEYFISDAQNHPPADKS
jgi:hypothetical protein